MHNSADAKTRTVSLPEAESCLISQTKRNAVRSGPIQRLRFVQPEGFSPDLRRKWVRIKSALTKTL
jgi:hypothetical protein